MNIKNHIPNTITCLNLFSGCIAVALAFQGNLLASALFIFASAIFDFFDGFAARKLQAFSIVGKDLDSLADLISFGLAPATMVSSLLKEYQYPEYMFDYAFIFPYIAYLIAVFSALRLAKFNNDERQSNTFIGLPTPANALFIAGFANAPSASFLWQPLTSFSDMWTNQVSGLFVLLGLIAISSFLLVSPIPMFSLKQTGKLQYVFLTISVILIGTCGFLGMFMSISVYILFSIFKIIATSKTIK